MKKTTILITILALSAGFAHSQIFNFPVSANQQLVEDAINGALFIIHSPYLMEDKQTGDTYGWNQAAYFSDSIYTFGVKTENGYYTTDKAFHPWKYDNKYKLNADSNSLVPVIADVEYRETDKDDYLPLPFIPEEYSVVRADLVYAVRDAQFDGKGLQLYKGKALNKAWVIWINTERPLSKQQYASVEYTVYRKEIIMDDMDDADGLYEITPPDINRFFVGGICIVPEVTNIGQINFRLAGLICPKDGKWYVARLEKAERAIREKTSEEKVEEKGLTPIRRSGARVKEQPDPKSREQPDDSKSKRKVKK
jgi:hypothetical protein